MLYGFFSLLVPEGGLEPPRVSPYAPQAYVSAISPPGPLLGVKPLEEGVLYFSTFECQSKRPSAVNRVNVLKKSILSLFLLGLFVYGMKASVFFPSFQLLKDSQWDLSLFPLLELKKVNVLLWFPAICKIQPIGSILLLPFYAFGFLGWMVWIRRTFMNGLEGPSVNLVALALAITMFSFYCFALGVNQILTFHPLFIFFLIGSVVGLLEYEENHEFLKIEFVLGPLSLPLIFWLFEYLSPPIIWDAVLDHFRFAEEVARLRQIPFHWTNHTGDMPKFVETLLAGFWVLGGETLAKMMSGLSALLMAYLFWVIAKEKDFSNKIVQWLFFTCPIFLAIFAWGYVEGFLAFYEVFAIYCLWRFLEKPGSRIWLAFCVFFLGVAFSIKYTAVLAIAACDVFLIFYGFKEKNWGLKRGPLMLLFFLPVVPWALRNELANGNPVYPLLTHLFGGPPGYNSAMETNLWQDTGKPLGWDVLAWGRLFWDSFFTTSNGVGAAWTPLVFMSLPWWGSLLKDRFAKFLLGVAVLFLVGWAFFCTDLRHAAGALILLCVLSALAWSEAFRQKGMGARWLFALGALVSMWLTVSAQLTTTAPYASALGLEEPLERLARNYSFNLDTYAAYRDIENNSGPADKVMTVGVFQTYPLRRMAFVDFNWKRPTLLEWASQCRTAEQLAQRFRREGVDWILYQKEEAIHSYGRNKDWKLEGIPEKEYLRFWMYFAEPVAQYDNSFVYRVRQKALDRPLLLQEVPGLQEPGFYEIQKAEFKGEAQKAYELAVAWSEKYPFVAEGWRQRAQAGEKIEPKDALVSWRKAARLGLSDPQGSSTLRQKVEQVKIEKALAFYREN